MALPILVHISSTSQPLSYKESSIHLNYALQKFPVQEWQSSFEFLAIKVIYFFQYSKRYGWPYMNKQDRIFLWDASRWDSWLGKEVKFYGICTHSTFDLSIYRLRQPYYDPDFGTVERNAINLLYRMINNFDDSIAICLFMFLNQSLSHLFMHPGHKWSFDCTILNLDQQYNWTSLQGQYCSQYIS